VISTACPYCLIMLDDAVKERQRDEEVKVLDISQVLERSLAVGATNGKAAPGRPKRRAPAQPAARIRPGSPAQPAAMIRRRAPAQPAARIRLIRQRVPRRLNRPRLDTDGPS